MNRPRTAGRGGLRLWWCLSWLCVMLVSGCATAPGTPWQGVTTEGLSQTVHLPVPFVAQEAHACGPASLYMALAAAGHEVPLQSLVDAAYLPERQGSLQVDMVTTVRRQGLLAYPLSPSLDALVRELNAGHPVLVFLNLSLPIYPVWHYAVAVGYDLQRQVLVLHSGPEAYSEMSVRTFERTWERAGRWALLALAPADLPATAQPEDLLRALSALEAVRPQSAQKTYEAAVQRWPEQRALWLGLANAAHAAHDTVGAGRALEQATQRFPDFADAWNNLAQWHAEQGQRTQALDAIDHAIRLGGVRAPQYRALRDSLSLPP